MGEWTDGRTETAHSTRLVSPPPTSANLSLLRIFCSLLHLALKMDEEFTDTQSILFLKRAILGLKAVEGERNIVEVRALAYSVRAVDTVLSMALLKGYVS